MHNLRRLGGTDSTKTNKTSLAHFLGASLLCSKENKISRDCQDFCLIIFALKKCSLLSKLFIYLDWTQRA